MSNIFSPGYIEIIDMKDLHRVLREPYNAYDILTLQSFG